MAAVLEFADVTVRRGEATLLDSVSWTVEEDERWVVLGPNGAGKTTLLQVASAQIHPTTGVAGILDEVLGTVDVFELRPRIGADQRRRWPSGSRGTSGCATWSSPRRTAWSGRWREEYDELDHARAEALLVEVGVGRPGRPHLRHPERGGAQAGPDRAGADDRPRAAAARRAGRRARPGRSRGPRSRRCPCWPHDPDSPATVLVSHHVEEIPPGFTHALLLREGQVVAAGPLDDVLTEQNLSATFGMPLVRHHADGRWTARRRPGTGPADSARCRDRLRHSAPGIGSSPWTGFRSTPGRPGWAPPIVLGVAEMFSLDLILLHARRRCRWSAWSPPCSGCRSRCRSFSPPSPRWPCWRWSGPSMVKRLHSGPELTLGHGKLVGQQGVVTEADHRPCSPAGSSWPARSGPPSPTTSTLTIAPGETVEVLRDPGATAFVHPVPTPRA